MASEADAVELVEALGSLGLCVGTGAWTFDGHPSPAQDVATVLSTRHVDWERIWPSAKERPRDPLKHTETWGSGLLRLDQPHTFMTIGVTRRGWDMWDVSIMVSPVRLHQAQLTVEEFAASWESLLVQIGDVLYERARPSIGLAYGTHDNIPDFSKPVLERQFGVGWRTWYGPTYVERYGHDWLRNIPDRTRDLPDGGIAHELDRPLLDVVLGSADLHDSVWPYLEGSGIAHPFWPRRRRAPNKSVGTAASNRARREDPPRAGQPESHVSAEAKMQAAAADAVDLARRRFRADLDYSERSIEKVEQILERIHHQSGVTEDELWALALAFGGYLGEVVRRRWGGDWRDQDDATGGVFPLVLGDVTLFPAHKVHKRLLDGGEENVWVFYDTVRGHLAAQRRS